MMVMARSTFLAWGVPWVGDDQGPATRSRRPLGNTAAAKSSTMKGARLRTEALASESSWRRNRTVERLSFGCKGWLLVSSPRNRGISGALHRVPATAALMAR